MSLFSALSNPTSYNHNVSPSIAEHPRASNGPFLSMPSSMGTPGGMITRDSRGAHYDSGGVQHTNGSDNRKYLQDCTNRVPGDTGQGQVAFEHVTTPNDAARAGNFMHQQAKVIYSWSTMHYMQKFSAMFRSLYGNDLSVSGVDMEKHFPVLGVQIWNQERLDNSKGILEYTDASNFCMSGRVNNVHNVWTLGKPAGTSVAELDVLMGMWRRHPYNGDEAMEDYVWAPQPAGSLVFDVNRNIQRRSHAIDRLQDAASTRRTQLATNVEFLGVHGMVGPDSLDKLFECTVERKVADPNQSIADAVDWSNFGEWQNNYRSSYDIRTPESAKQEWYWSLDPFVSSDRQPPPFALYNSPYYSGSVVTMGTVIHVTRGDNNVSPATQARAARALFPKTRSRDYLTDLYALDQLELHWNVGKMLGA